MDRVFSLIDGTSGPSDWPSLRLMNTATGEPLSTDLAGALSDVESEYLDTIEPPVLDDDLETQGE